MPDGHTVNTATIIPTNLQSPSENCLSLGTRLAEFEIRSIIGEGGFGIVYQAFDHSLQRVVAIKEYMPSALAGRGADQRVAVRSKRQQETFDTGLRSFIHEARLLAQFDHPALIKVYRYWEENGTAYMAMRCYQGVTLKSVIANDPARVTEAWLLGFLKPILEALDVLYKVQILHRDISPDNIIIQESGEPVLLDFGAARQIIGDMTQALTVILKPGYAPIEQYADDPSMKQGPWSDIYSLSAVVYALVARKPPPTSVARMISDPIEILSSADYPGFTVSFRKAIDRGLAVRPEERPQSIDEFRQLLGIERLAQDQQDAKSALVIPIAAVPSKPRGAVESKVDRTARPSSSGQKTSPKQASLSAKPGKAKRRNRASTMAWSALIIGVLITAGSGGVLLLNRGKGPPVEALGAATLPGKSGASAALPAAAPLTSAMGPTPAGAAAGAPARLLQDAETSAWETLYDENPVRPEAVNNFLMKYPSGKYAELAKAKLAEIASGTAAKSSLSAATGKPVSAQENNQASDEEARAWEALAGNRAARPVQFRQFIRQFPNGKFLALARARLSEFRARNSVDELAPEAAPENGKPAENSSAVAARTIKISIKPWGNVLLDGTEKGVSPPLKKLVIPDGKHQIRIVNPNFPDHVIEIDASKKKLESIDYDFLPVKK